jgi:hypothetical protein
MNLRGQRRNLDVGLKLRNAANVVLARQVDMARQPPRASGGRPDGEKTIRGRQAP